MMTMTTTMMLLMMTYLQTLGISYAESILSFPAATAEVSNRGARFVSLASSSKARRSS